jgi:predicted O-methyltransferase YrrM
MIISDDPIYRLLHDGDVYAGLDPNAYEKILYGWNDDNEIFGRLIEELRPKYILELGSWLGASSIHMGKAIKRLGLDTKIVCVDTWLGSREFMGKKFPGDRSKLVINGMPNSYKHFLMNIKREGLQDVVIPLPQTTSNALRFFSEEGVRFDMVYVDASNQYEDIVSDMNLSWNVLANGGVIFGDDYLNFSYPQINAAVNSFVYGNRIRDQLSVDSENNFWSIKKKGLL